MNEIHDQASNFQNPTIYLYGDFNEYEKTLESWVKKNEQLLSLNRLSIFDDYEHPFEYLKGLNHISPLVTRQDIHHLGASRIDYILSNSRLQAKTCNWMGYDHATFIIKMPILKTKHRKVTVSKRATILSDLSSIGKRSLQDYVNLIRDNLNEYHFKMNTVRGMTDSFGLDMKQDANTAVTSWIKKFSLFASMTSLMRFSIYQGEAFKILRKVTKYDQFLKRDGSIVSTIRSNSGPLITDQEIVEQTLITSLRERDDALVLNSCHPILRTASPLPPLSHSEITNLISRLSRHKSLSEFPFPDEFLHKLSEVGHLVILNQLWNPEFLAANPEIFRAKLIPLNKAHPKVPTINQVRPIVATSCLFKLLEIRFNDELNQLFQRLPLLGTSQVGFLKRMTTHVNITRLCDYVSKDYTLENGIYKKLPRTDTLDNKHLKIFVFFIDFEQAYNSIRLDKLILGLKKLPGVDKENLNFLFWAYSQLQICLGNYSFRPKHGVPQGGINSPILFNFALYFMLEELTKSLIDSQRMTTSGNKPKILVDYSNSFLFADDSAFAFKFRYSSTEWIKCRLKLFYKLLISVSRKWGLKINHNKSALMLMHNKSTKFGSWSDSPVE